MSIVIGNSEDATKLADVVRLTIQALQATIEQLKKLNRDVKDAWDDPYEAPLDEIIRDLTRALNNSIEGVEGLEKDIRAYAAFLENA